MRGRFTVWALACALLLGPGMQAVVPGAMAATCVEVTTSIGDDGGHRWASCQDDPTIPEAPGAPAPEPWDGEPPSPDPEDPEGTVERARQAHVRESRCQRILHLDNRPYENTTVDACVLLEARPPDEWLDLPLVETDPCRLENQEGTDPRVRYGGGGAAACVLLNVTPGGLVAVSTDDCPPEEDTGDPSVRVREHYYRVCPERHVPEPDEGPQAPGTPQAPQMPSSPGSVYSLVRDTRDGAQPPGDPTPSMPSSPGSVYSLIRDAGNARASHATCQDVSQGQPGSTTRLAVCVRARAALGTDGVGAPTLEAHGCRLQNGNGTESRLAYGDGGAAACAWAEADPGLGARVDDERCPDDLLPASTLHAAGWTAWVCVNDPTA